jgi:hypothetical protein
MRSCSKGFESDASIREFLAGGSSLRSSKADEAGPNQLDIRELRSLSLSMPNFSGPICVSLPECDLKDLCILVGANSFKANSASLKVPICPCSLPGSSLKDLRMRVLAALDVNMCWLSTPAGHARVWQARLWHWMVKQL